MEFSKLSYWDWLLLKTSLFLKTSQNSLSGTNAGDGSRERRGVEHYLLSR